MALSMHLIHANIFPILLLTAVCISSCGNPSRNPVIGTWISDEKKTLEEVAKIPNMPQKTRDLLENGFFGKLKITYYRDHYVTELDGHVSKYDYKVLGINDRYVEIEYYDVPMRVNIREKIYIDGDAIYVYGSLRYKFKEYFRRVNGGV